MDEGLIDVQTLCARLHVPASWVYSRTARNAKEPIPHLRCGKYIRFDLAEVLAWLRSRPQVSDDAR